MTDKKYRCHRKLASTSPFCIRFSFVEHHVLDIGHAILLLKTYFGNLLLLNLQ